MMIANRFPAALLCSLVLVSAARAEFPPEGRLTVSTYKARQGDVVVVGLRGPRGVARVEGQFLDLPVKDKQKLVEGPSLRLLSFYPTEEGEYESLLGIDVADKPGHHILRVYVMSPGGATLVLKRAIEITPGKFPVDRLTVENRLVDPDDETAGRIEEERKKMEEVLEQHSPRAFASAFRLPVQGQVTSSFGRRRILNGKESGPHTGTDIRAPVGAVVRAPAPGTVALAEEHVLPGNAVVLDHGLGLLTGYFHLREIRVRPGQTVAPGDVLGFVGATGRVTGPHLHWMARAAGARIDPVSLGRMRLARPTAESASAPIDEPASPEPEEADPASRS